jgi:hypothetical protein
MPKTFIPLFLLLDCAFYPAERRSEDSPTVSNTDPSQIAQESMKDSFNRLDVPASRDRRAERGLDAPSVISEKSPYQMEEHKEPPLEKERDYQWLLKKASWQEFWLFLDELVDWNKKREEFRPAGAGAQKVTVFSSEQDPITT